ncbi:hypothetical protein [Salinispora arenicola]|uniref:hypothetical protein n=1 Tax=Salinispora arenicola TaxID=168697 RepID=UPI000381620A|nr:hypothetical protein [Salinispora arenicola]
MQVMTGRVSTRKGARHHLALHGLAYCGAGTGRVIDAQPLTPTQAHALTGQVCRRCAAALDRRVRELVHEAMYRSNQNATDAYTTLSEALDSPAERDRQEALVQDMRSRILARRPHRPLSGWGALRAGWQAAADRDRAARHTAQAELFPAA